MLSRRTETDTTWANPNGSLTTEFELSPRRVRRDGEWVPVNLALEKRARGRWVPKAGPVGLSVSGGGSGPVVEVADAAHGLSLSWTERLPAASVSGRVAEYDLGSGAVLQVTSTVDGVWLRVVLSKRPTEEPVWRLPLRLDGLTVRESPQGSYLFTDAAGETVFAIPAPRMWDATVTEDGLPKREAMVDSRLVREGGELLLELAPSAAFLADEATVYPVTVDPDVTAEVAGVRDTYVQQGVTGARGGAAKLFTGLLSGGDITRSFVAFDTAPLNGAKITKAELKMLNVFSGSCTASPVYVRPVTEDWENATTVWTNQPSYSTNDAYLGKKSFAYGNAGAGCPTTKWGVIDVTPIVTERTDQDGVMEVDYGMRVASNESYASKRHTFCSFNPGAAADAPCDKADNRPKLVVTYNKTPNTPTGQATDPAQSCATGPSAPAMPTSSPSLKANVSDPDGGLVYGEFEVALASNTGTVVASGTSGAVTSPGTATWKPTKGKLVNGTKYAWRVRSYDLQRRSAYTGWCEFTVSLDAPTLNAPTTIHATGAELTWPTYSNPNEPFTEYQVHRGTTAGFTPSDATYVTALPTNATAFTDTDAPPTPADAPSETGSTVYYKLAVKTEGGTLVSSAARAAALPKAGRTTKIIQASVTDTTLSEKQASTNLDNLGGQNAVEVSNDTSTTYGATRAVLKFADLSALPAGSRVMDADLSLWATGSTGSGAGFNAHALTSGFAETTATWNQSNTGTPWTSAGGDYTVAPANPTPAAVGGTGTWVDLKVGSAVSGWVTTPASNHGLLVKTAATTPVQRVTFASSEAAAEQQPRLLVTYLTKSTASTYYAPHTPQLMVPNSDEQVTVTVTNTTADPWNPDQWVLSYKWLNPDGSPHSTPAESSSLQHPGNLPPGENLAPGEQVDLIRTVKPPINAAHGRSQWILAWDMHNTATGEWLSQKEPIPPLEQTVAVEDPGKVKNGLEDFYQYVGQATGAGSAVLVNQHSGNATFTYDAFSNPSRGVNTFLRMTYNSDDHTDSGAGFGWSLSPSTITRLGTPLDVGKENTTPDVVRLTDGDGSLHEFPLDKQTGEYQHPPGVHLYLQRLTPGEGDNRAWVMTAPDRTRFYFDAEGYHIATVDRNDNTLKLTYDSLENPSDPKQRYLTSITDPDGRTTLQVSYYMKGETYTYIDTLGARKTEVENLTDSDIYGHVKSITDISGDSREGDGVADRTVTFYYTKAGLLAEMVDGRDVDQAPAEEKKIFRFTYDPVQENTNTKLEVVEDPLGRTTSLTYHDVPPGENAPNHWKTETITDRAASGGVTRFVYDPDAQAGDQVTSTVTDAENRDTVYTIDGFGRPIQITDAKQRVTKLSWDTDHNVTKLEEPAAQSGGTTAKSQWAYDPETGYPLVMIDAEANGSTFDPNPLTTTKPHTRFTYDPSPGALGGHVADLKTKTSPLGSTWDFGYDGYGNLTTVTDPEGVATSTKPDDYQTTYTYHRVPDPNDPTVQRPNGLLETATDANGHTTRYEAYDDNGYPERITDAKGFDTTFKYDARGNVRFVTDAKTKTSTYTYDLFSRPLQTQVPKSGTETIVTPAPKYDANDNVLEAYAPYVNTAPTSLTTWAYKYDHLDQLDTITEPLDQAGDDPRLTDYDYDKVGNLTKIVEPNAPTTATAGDFTTTYHYDPVDQLDWQTDGDGDKSEYDYDNAGNLITVRNPGKVDSESTTDYTAKYTYDLNHRLLTGTDADGGNPYEYTYDDDGRVATVTDEAVKQTTFDYDKRGLLTRVTRPHTSTENRVTEYIYDQVGNRTHVVSQRGVDTPATDPNAPEAKDYLTRYVYDELNRVDKQFFPCAPPDPCNPDAEDEGEWPDYVDYDYDEVGNLETVSRPPSQDAKDVRAETTYTYTDNSWVKTSVDPWEITTSYDYNAMGLQTSRTLTPAGENPPGTPPESQASRVMTWTYTPDGKLESRTDEGVPVSRRVVLVDNSDTQNTTAAGGGWAATSSAVGDAKSYQGHNYQTHPAGTGTATVTWDLAVPKAGTWEVFARIGAEATATTASYKVHHSGTGSPAALTRNQSTNVGTWLSLGSYTFAKGTSGQKVVLSDANAGGVVAADAIKLVRTTTETDTERKSYAYRYDPNANLSAITDNSRNANGQGPVVDYYGVSYTGANQVDQVIEKAGGSNGTPRKTTDFGYNPNGAIEVLDHTTAGPAPDQHSAYTYDLRDLLTEVSVGTSASDPNPKITSFGYDARGLRQTQTKANDNTVTYDYYADGLLKESHETRSTGTDVARHQLTYTRNGHRDTDTTRLLNADTGGYLDFVRDYDYDPRDRVTKVEKRNLTDTVLETETYTYDGASNVTWQQIKDDTNNTTTTTDFTYDRDRLLKATANGTPADYNYDPYGRLDTVILGGTGTDAGTVLEAYDYDGFDRVEKHTKYASGGNTTTAYTYDPLDRTAGRTKDDGTPSAKTRYFTYLGLTDTLITEAATADGTNPDKTYQYTPWGERLSQTKHLTGGGTEDSYYGYNPHTDVETLTKPDGTTRATYGYTAYGLNDDDAFTGVDKPDPNNPTKEPYNPYRYTGKRWDEATQNLDMGFRDYSPGLNRFLTLDSYNGALNDLNLSTSPWTSNRYGLAGGNPITGIEIDGHEAESGGGGSTPTNPGWEDAGASSVGGTGPVESTDNGLSPGPSVVEAGYREARDSIAGIPGGLRDLFFGSAMGLATTSTSMPPQTGVTLSNEALKVQGRGLQATSEGALTLSMILPPAGGAGVGIRAGARGLRGLLARPLRQTAAKTLAGSGPVPGVLEASGRVKSFAALRNYNPKGGVEYVFDPATGTFAVGRPAASAGLKGSPHQQLAQSIGANPSSVVGGTLTRGPNGAFITTEQSGHFWQNWTPAIRDQFVSTMRGYGFDVIH